MTEPRYARAADLDSWQTDHRIAERGFTHPWRSTVAAGNGEDEFVTALDNLVRPDDVVLDLGCGHGELTIAVAARAARVIGVDRDPDRLALARRLTGAIDEQTSNLAGLAELIARNGDPRGVPLRHQRLLAQFRLPRNAGR